MKTINRRYFLKTTALGAAAVGLPAYSWASAKGANEAIRVAVVGFGGRGADHISGMRGLANKNVRIVALCDVDSKILNAGVESFAKRNEKVERYTDIRRLLENKDVDAITIATPNHWHSLATIWAGQAGKDVYVEKPVSHNVWDGFWDYGCGDLGDQGIHQMDIARWFLGEDALSPRVASIGGRLGYEDDGETPNTQFVFHDYEKAPLIFEVRGLPEKTDAKEMDKYPKQNGGSVAVIIHCEGGHVLVPNYTGAAAFDKEGKEIKKWTGAANHFEDFIDAVRSRKHTDLNADILEGHLSSALCHTGNVSYRLRPHAKPHEIRERIKGGKEALETFERMAEHLAANGVDLEKTKATLGVGLKMDPRKEQFLGNAEANKLLTRDYRKPFVVPEKV